MPHQVSRGAGRQASPAAAQKSLRRRCALAVSTEAKIIAGILRKFPTTVILPLLLLAVLLALELPGVHIFKQEMIKARQLKSTLLSESVAASMQLQLQVALRPMQTLETVILAAPYWSKLQKLALSVGNATVQPGPIDETITVTVIPNGRLALVFPLSRIYDTTELQGSEPLDLLNDTNRLGTLQYIRDGKVQYFPLKDINSFSITKPLYIDGAAPNETFGYPFAPTNCNVCYDPTKKRRFWGFVNSVIPQKTVIGPREKELAQLAELARYTIHAPLDKDYSVYTVAAGVNITKTTNVEQVDDGKVLVLASSKTPAKLSSSWKTKVEITSEYGWWLYVETGYDDISQFTDALFAALVVGTFILSGMFFATLLSRRKHQLLLESLVPDTIIKQAKVQAEYITDNKPIITVGSTADLMLKIASEVATGKLPSVGDALTLRTAATQRWDLYAPINLGRQLRQGPLDAEVAEALMQQLLGRSSPSNQMALQVPTKAGNDDGWGFFESFSNLSAGLVALLPSTIPSLSRVSATGSQHSDEGHVSIVVDQVLLDRAETILGIANSSWQFDVLELYKATNGYPLSTLGFFLMHQHGMISKLKLEPGKLARFLRNVEDGYRRTTPFHNSTHAAASLQTMHMMLTHGGLLSGGYADDLTMLASYIAAIIVDFDHCGLTNDFLISTQDDMACQYNDKSPLENHHIAAAWFLLKQQNMNFLQPNLTKPQLDTLRKMIIDMVTATDMKQHFSIVNVFTATTRNQNPAGVPLKKSIVPSKAVNEGERITLLQMALKCADLSYTTANLKVHKRWLSCLEEELFKQGDREAALGLPISPLFDRKKPGISKSQAGFFNVVALPMYSAFCSAFPAANPLLEGAKSNFEYWKAVQPLHAIDHEAFMPHL